MTDLLERDDLHAALRDAEGASVGSVDTLVENGLAAPSEPRSQVSRRFHTLLRR